jgi:hypothetical protein
MNVFNLGTREGQDFKLLAKMTGSTAMRAAASLRVTRFDNGRKGARLCEPGHDHRTDDGTEKYPVPPSMYKHVKVSAQDDNHGNRVSGV